MVSSGEGERIAVLEARMDNMQREQQKAEVAFAAIQTQLSTMQSTLDRAAGGAKAFQIIGIGTLMAKLGGAIAWFTGFSGKHP